MAPSPKINTLIFLWAILAAIVSPTFGNEPGKIPRISRITLRSTDVFDFESAPYLKKFPYNLINFLHIKTNDRIIRQEFLFKVGDPADPFLIQETERNLRRLPFINAARIAQFPQRDGTVALVVNVSDSWTTEPYISIGGMNKLDTPKIGFKEKNLLGYGKQMEFSYDEKNNFERVYRYKDLRFFATRWQLIADEVQQNNSETQRIEILRPFFSADTRFSAGASFSKTDQTVDDIENNVAVSEYNASREVSQFTGGMKVGHGRTIVNRLSLRYKMDRSWYSPNSKSDPNRPVPDHLELKTIFLDWNTTRNKFVKLRRIERLTRVEDFNLGPSVTVSPGESVHALSGGQNNAFFEAQYEQNFLAPDKRFCMLQMNYSGRNLDTQPANQKLLLDLRLYHLRLPNQTLVARGQAQLGKNLDINNQISIGGNAGLRAYPADTAIGNKSLVFNLEDRLYFIDELWSLCSLGGVVFFDSGYAWPQGQNVDLRDMLNDVGAGLRVAMTRSSDEIILRFDVSYRLTPISSDSEKFVFTFGSSQAF